MIKVCFVKLGRRSHSVTCLMTSCSESKFVIVKLVREQREFVMLSSLKWLEVLFW